MKVKQLHLLLVALAFVLTGNAHGQSAEYYYNQGSEILQLGDYRDAIVAFNKALEIDPELVDAYIKRATAKSKLNDYRGAIADYNKAIQIDPENADTYYNRAIVKILLGDYRGASADISKGRYFRSAIAHYKAGYQVPF